MQHISYSNTGTTKYGLCWDCAPTIRICFEHLNYSECSLAHIH